MSTAVIGALRVVLGMDSAAFNDGVGAAQKRVAGFRKSMERAGRRLTRAGTRMSAGLTAPLVGLAYKSVAAQREQERAIASVSAALESMGDGAGYTLQQLESMASKLQDKSLYGDEEILSKVTANLLTFGNVQGEVFDRAQRVAVDLSARLGQDLQSSAIMLGKALNDPIQGLTALSRVGVSFTEEQKEQIKAMAEAGDVAGAQALMLAELERQYAGQAEALANTDSGKITQAMNAIGDASEKVGAIILPILADIADHVKVMAQKFQDLSPETQKFVVFGGAVAAVIGPMVAALGLMLTALAPLAGAVLAIVSPLGLLVAGVVAVGVAIYQNWDSLKEDFPAITGAIEAALEGLKAAFERILEAARVYFEGIKEHLRLLATGLEALLNGDFRGVMDAGVAIVQGFRRTMAGVFQALFGDLVAVWRKGIDSVRQFGADLLAVLAQLLKDAVEAAMNIGREIINGLKAGIEEKWQDIKDYVHSLAAQLPEWIRKPLGIQSPSRVFKEIGGFITDGLVLGIQGGIDSIQGAVGQMADALQMDGLSGQVQVAENAFDKLGRTAGSVFGRVGKLIGEGIRGAKSFKDVLSGVAQNMAKVLTQQAQTSLVGMFGGSGSLGGSLVSGIFGGLLGFANGGSFDVGGAGGIDSQVVAFRASPNETVHVTKPGQSYGDGAPSIVHLVVEASEDLRVVAADAGRSATVQVVQENNSAIHQGQRRG